MLLDAFTVLSTFAVKLLYCTVTVMPAGHREIRVLYTRLRHTQYSVHAHIPHGMDMTENYADGAVIAASMVTKKLYPFSGHVCNHLPEHSSNGCDPAVVA